MGSRGRAMMVMAGEEVWEVVVIPRDFSLRLFNFSISRRTSLGPPCLEEELPSSTRHSNILQSKVLSRGARRRSCVMFFFLRFRVLLGKEISRFCFMVMYLLDDTKVCREIYQPGFLVLVFISVCVHDRKRLFDSYAL